jgi:hypothetical protein
MARELAGEHHEIEPPTSALHGGVTTVDGPPRLSQTAREAIRVAIAGYAVASLFGATYGVIALLWPTLSTSTNTVIAALVAAPSALALIWPRLVTAKAFGVEVSLAHASADALEPDLVEAVMGAIYSGDRAGMESVADAPLESEGPSILSDMSHPFEFLDELRKTAPELLFTVDLGGGKNWWSTQLYLLAAITDDFMGVPQFVFISRYPRDVFVGMATPSALRTALGQALPSAVDEAYLAARKDSANLPLGDRLQHVARVFLQDVADIERADLAGSGVSGSFWVNGDRLYDCLSAAGKRFNTEAIVVTGLSREQLVLGVAQDSRERHVALVGATGRLDTIVDRLDVLAQAAQARHRPLLWRTRRASESAARER